MCLPEKNVFELGDGTFPEIKVGSCGVIKYVKLMFVVYFILLKCHFSVICILVFTLFNLQTLKFQLPSTSTVLVQGRMQKIAKGSSNQGP